jgi:hypothetical protein
MSLKMKMLGLCILATVAVSAVVVANAAATAGGHFVSNRALTTLEVIETSSDTLEFFAGPTKGIPCENATYHGWFAGTTVTAFTLTPEYKECLTTGGKVGGVTITTHGCAFEFTVRADPENKHNTLHIKCPSGKKITIVDTEAGGGSCTTEVGPQTVEGVVYKKISWEGTEALTAEFTVKKIQYTFHVGVCVFLGTNHADGELKGSVIIKAWNTENPEQGADITAT